MYFKKVIVVGSTNTDMVIKTDHLPVPGETILGGDFFMNPGGKGANQAVAAARLGGKVTFISKTGNDIFGKQAVQNFENEGINTDFMVTDADNPSGVALITVDAHAENCIVVAPGANGTLKSDDLEAAMGELHEAEIILMQLEIPLNTVEFVAQLTAKKGKKVILNPAPAQELPDTLLKNIYILTPNITEAEILTGLKVDAENVESVKNAAMYIRDKGVNNVIITLGSKGAYILSDSICELVPAPKVQPVDTTAAGDVFNGALAVALSEKFDIEKAVKFANKAASLAVTRLGAQSSAPYWKEIE